jgi:predicted transposase YbfD/YdcC
LIVQLKSNQPTLLDTAQRIALEVAPRAVHLSRDKGRNRDESRIVSTYEPADLIADADWRSHVRAIIKVERRVFTRSARTGLLSLSTETAFYIANRKLDATPAAQAIRAHWKIETTSHYTRDETFGEDRSRIRTNPGAFARIRSFADNSLKANQSSSSIRQERYRAALAGPNYIASFNHI